MKHIKIEEKRESFYKPKKLENLSFKIKEKLEEKKNPSLFKKLKNSIFG